MVKVMRGEDRNISSWKKAAACAIQTCVEVKRTPQVVYVRDSKESDVTDSYTILSTTPSQWIEFLASVRRSPAEGTTSMLSYLTDQFGHVTLTDRAGSTLQYDSEEWIAFCTGVHEGDFDLEQTPVRV